MLLFIYDFHYLWKLKANMPANEMNENVYFLCKQILAEYSVSNHQIIQNQIIIIGFPSLCEQKVIYAW